MSPRQRRSQSPHRDRGDQRDRLDMEREVGRRTRREREFDKFRREQYSRESERATDRGRITQRPGRRRTRSRSRQQQRTRDRECSRRDRRSRSKGRAVVELNVCYMRFLPRIIKAPSFYTRRTCSESAETSILVDAPTPVIPFLCPISRQRQTVPVRTLRCRHVDTFDLSTYLATTSDSKLSSFEGGGSVCSRQNHTCPICKERSPLYIDPKIQAALMDFPDVTEAGVDPDTGQLGRPVKEAGLDASCLDLVTPTQPRRMKHSIVDLVTPTQSQRKKFSIVDRIAATSS